MGGRQLRHLHKSTSEASAPAVGFLLPTCPSWSGNRSRAWVACNPTGGRGLRSLVAQAFNNRLHKAPHGGKEPRVCPVNSPAQTAPCVGKVQLISTSNPSFKQQNASSSHPLPLDYTEATLKPPTVVLFFFFFF